MNIAIIGGGHIGGACAIGLSDAVQVTVTARSESTLSKYLGTKVRTSLSNADAVRGADIVMFCVKTAQMPDAVASVAGLMEGRLAVSMAAQVSPEEMQAMLGPGVELAYVIPNTAAAHKQSMTFIANVSASQKSVDALERLFNNVGRTSIVPLKMLPAGISLASCGIGYALKYISAASKGGVELGFSEEEAVRIVTQTVLGAAVVQGASADTPEQEVRKVATPGGLTERGVRAMDEAGFTNAVISGLCPE